MDTQRPNPRHTFVLAHPIVRAGGVDILDYKAVELYKGDRWTTIFTVNR